MITPRPRRLAALLTTHERVETTLACLRAVQDQALDGVSLDVVVADAGSRDGTPEAVRELLPDADVFDVGADTFWNGGMYLAWRRILDRSHDAYLWLNDDTVLDPDAVDRLLTTLVAVPGPAVVVGSTRDPGSGELTYGGVHRPERLRPLRYELIPPGDAPLPAETMNGNCVLVPRPVVERIGILDPVYTHGMGDYDYGHRARSHGCGVWVAPGTVGTCSRNPTVVADDARGQWQQLRRPTGLPPGDFATFARRWAGPLWPVYWASPYVRRLARAALRQRGSG